MNEDNNVTEKDIEEGKTKLTLLSLFQESRKGAEDTDKLQWKKGMGLGLSLFVRRHYCNEGSHEMKCNGMESNEMKCDAVPAATSFSVLVIPSCLYCALVQLKLIPFHQALGVCHIPSLALIHSTFC